eukprot:ANDGO_00639.mRNA.1 Polypyrimidine tract-binding protein homolog 3
MSSSNANSNANSNAVTGPASTPVLFLRNLPPNCTDSELRTLFSSIGCPLEVALVLDAKKQAFVQVGSVAKADEATRILSQQASQIRNHTIYASYSSRKSVTLERNAEGAEGAEGGVQSGGGSGRFQRGDRGSSMNRSSGHASGGSNVGDDDANTGSSSNNNPQSNNNPNRVIHITVSNMIYPVTVEVLHKVFSSYGTVQRILTFTRSGAFQAFIEYEALTAATTAHTLLNGHNIYPGCCTITVHYSRLQELNIRYDSEYQRDFTRAPVPPPSGSSSGSASGAPHHHQSGSGSNSSGGPTGSGNAALASSSGPSSSSMNNGNNGEGPASGPPGSVVMVSNLNPDRVSPDALFMLFGAFGDVMRVKIFYNKRDSALVQFADAQQAQTALQHLHNCPLYGRPLRVRVSTNAYVAVPRAGQDDAGLTRDFSSSHLHRFRIPNSRNFKNIFAPSAVLHVSNIPNAVSEEEIAKILGGDERVLIVRKMQPQQQQPGQGAEDKNAALQNRSTYMALVKFRSVEAAVDALVENHDRKMGDGERQPHLRVSFSSKHDI